jgi:hypothetical protein
MWLWIFRIISSAVTLTLFFVHLSYYFRAHKLSNAPEFTKSWMLDKDLPDDGRKYRDRSLRLAFALFVSVLVTLVLWQGAWE